VKWSLFPNVDLVDFGAVDAGVNVVLIVKANGGLDEVMNGELCGEVNTNANATLNAIPNAKDNREGKEVLPKSVKCSDLNPYVFEVKGYEK